METAETKLKICMFTNTYLPHVGGVARSISAFVEDLRELGHDVLVIAPTFPEVEAGENESEEGIYRVPAIQNFNGSDFSVRFPLPYFLAEKIDSFEPDLIHSHHPFLLGDTALRIAVSRQIPLIFTHHTLYENYTHYVPLDSEAMQQFVINLATEYANLCDMVIAPSNSVAKILRKRGVTSPVQVLPTGIDIKFFSNGQGEACRRRMKIDPEDLVIGHVGRLAKEKNLIFLAEAVSASLQQIKKTKAFFVGDGDAKEEIQQIFERAGLEHQLYLPGSLQGEELADAYRAMDLFVFASKSETQGLVLAEAMAAGLPVVALDASGVREVVAHGQNGLMLDEATTVEQFSFAVTELLADQQKRNNFKKGTFQTAQKFSRRHAADNLLKLYRKVKMLKEKNQYKEISVFDDIQLALKAEWSLLREKMNAATRSF